MRRASPWIALAVLLAGCTTAFPEGTRIVTQFETGPMAPGDVVLHNFTLAAPGSHLLVGGRTGGERHLHVLMHGPGGATFDLRHADPAVACEVRDPRPGAWSLELRADLLDGALQGGKFTVRTGSTGLPAHYTCADQRFPGPGRNLTLGAWHVNLTANETLDASFDQPFALERVGATVLGFDAANTTLLLTPPGGAPMVPSDLPLPPATGTWRVAASSRIGAAPNATNITIAVWGIGAK